MRTSIVFLQTMVDDARLKILDESKLQPRKPVRIIVEALSVDFVMLHSHDILHGFVVIVEGCAN